MGNISRNVKRVYLNTELLSILDDSNREGYVRNFPLANKRTIPFRAIMTLWVVLNKGSYTDEDRFTLKDLISPGLSQLILDQRCLPLASLKKCAPELDYESLRHYCYRGWTHEIRFIYSVSSIFNVPIGQIVPGFDADSVEAFYWDNVEWARRDLMKNKDSKSPEMRAMLEASEKLFPLRREIDLL